ncbi:hypothetical protein [Miltoncostaea oceani]|uniref:hypothetical protein n=1 Tax=Miltoncostaea oceani TaxID=2843216 RepID=UPI001C3CF4CE|nr:hypothetical protein [Miltoncostaea oceani]
MRRPWDSGGAANLAAWAALIVLAGLLLSGCGGSDSEASVSVRTVTVTEGSDAAAEAPSAQEGAEVTEEINGRTVLPRKIGQTGTDGAIAFRVTALGPSETIPLEYSDPIAAPSGARLILATVEIRNVGSVKVDPFCGNTGAILIDDQGRNFEADMDSVSITGNSICTGVQPGFRSTEKLAFAIPDGAKVSALALWDRDEADDYEGMTYVRFSR